MNHQIQRIKIDAFPFVGVCLCAPARFCAVFLCGHCIRHLQSYSVFYVVNMMHSQCQSHVMVFNSVSKCTARLHDPLHISYILSVLTRSYRDLVFLKMRMRNQVDRVSHIKELAGSNFCSRPRLTASARIVCRLLMM